MREHETTARRDHTRRAPLPAAGLLAANVNALAPALVLALILILILIQTPAWALDVQGHRGARGLAPENTLAGFRTALAIGVTTLELDLAMTADGALVVTHDRRLSPSLVRDRTGRWLAPPGPLVHSLRAVELEAFDVGRVDPDSRYAQRFPDQRPVDGERIPRFAAVIALARDAHVGLNVEIKTDPGSADETPAPARFAETVVGELRGQGFPNATIQSFDWRALAYVQRIAPEYPTAYLTASQRWLDNLERGRPGPSPWTAGIDIDEYAGSAPQAVAAAGGAIWSPYYQELDAASLAAAHRLGLRVVVWTVNAPQDMARLIDLGVDGIITDRPDLLRTVMAARAMVLPPAR